MRSVANDIALAWAEGLSAVSLSALGTADVGSFSKPIQLAKPIFAMNAFQHALLVAEFRFQGSKAAESALIELMDSALWPLHGNELDKTACGRLVNAMHVDFCGLVLQATPRYYLESLALQKVTRGSSSKSSTVSAIQRKRRGLNITPSPTKYVNQQSSQYNKIKSPWNTFTTVFQGFKNTFEKFTAAHEASELMKKQNNLVDRLTTQKSIVAEFEKLDGSAQKYDDEANQIAQAAQAEIKVVEEDFVKLEKEAGLKNGKALERDVKMGFEGKLAVAEGIIAGIGVVLAITDLVFSFLTDDPTSNANIYSLEIDICK